jgi:hypothetical protein
MWASRRVRRQRLAHLEAKTVPDWLIYLTPILASIAAVFAILAFFRAGRPGGQDSAAQDKILELVRLECDRVRQSADNNAGHLRQELNDKAKLFS